MERRQGVCERFRQSRGATRCLICLLMVLLLLCVSCAKRDLEAERRAAVTATWAKLQACLPAQTTLQNAADTENLQLTLVSVVREPNQTRVRLTAYVVRESAEFSLPVYSLSRGRWLIRESGRTYLLDEQCREFKLKERGTTAGQAVPVAGNLTLWPGQAVEATLLFPRLPDDVQMGVLLYDGRALSFSLWQAPVVVEGR